MLYGGSSTARTEKLVRFDGNMEGAKCRAMPEKKQLFAEKDSRLGKVHLPEDRFDYFKKTDIQLFDLKYHISV